MDKICDPQNSVGDVSDVRPATPLRATNHVFAPERIVEAIRFHLVDEAIASRVCPRSIERVVKRMVRAALLVEIPAARWREMKNRQRLEWLLVSSCTDYRVAARDGTAVLV